MHESTRRRLCRAAFGLACVLPTALALLWCYWQGQPARVAEAESQLTALTGLSARVGSVSRPRPGVVRLSDVQLNEPESGALVARCDKLELRSYRNLAKASLVGARIDADRLAALWPAIDRRMQRWQTDWPAVAVQCNEIEVRSAHGQLKLRAADCDLAGLRRTPDEVQAWAAFQVAEVDNAGKVTLWARRKKQASRPSTRFEVVSGEAWLPAWLLANGCAPLAQVHPEARLRGKFAAVQNASGWDAEVEGLEMQGRDLHRALSGRLPSFGVWPLRVRIDHAKLREGRIERAEGSVRGGKSEVSLETLSWIEGALGLQLHTRAISGTLPFDEMYAGFRLDHEGVHLDGHCQQSRSGVLLRGKKLVLEAPQQHLQPSDVLIELFAEKTSRTVSTGSATAGLLSLMPEPSLFKVSKHQQFEQTNSKLR
jgi:hypothetical protein